MVALASRDATHGRLTEEGQTAFKELLYKEDSALGKVKMQLVEQQRVACGREAQEAKQQQEAHSKLQMKLCEDSVDLPRRPLDTKTAKHKITKSTRGFK